MKKNFLLGGIALYVLLMNSAVGYAADQKLPKMEGKETLATVNGEPITMEDLDKLLVTTHIGMGEYKKAGGINYSEALKRLINTRLILLEAHNIGLDELPEIKEADENYSKRALVEILNREQTKDIKVTEEEVNRRYKALVREYKLNTLLIEKEKDARKIEKEIREGRDFSEIAERGLKEGIVKVSETGEAVKDADLLPQIKKEVLEMKVGDVSPIITVKEGFVILKLEERRFPEDPQAREQARSIVLNTKKFKVLADYTEALKEKYAKINQDLVDSLDFESEDPGFEELLKDERAVVEIEGEEPVTVRDMAKAFEKKFFHGVNKAIEQKKVNKNKMETLHKILSDRVLMKEALREGIDKTDTYKRTVDEYKRSIVFEKFMQTVIAPNIRLEKKDLTAYYEKHIEEFSTSARVETRSLVFPDRDKAEEALNKLEKGTDYKWLKANAEGQVDKETEGLLDLDGEQVLSDLLAEGVRKTLTGTRPGDIKIYRSPEGHFYVLYIQDITPPKPVPFEKVQDQIIKEVFNLKLIQNMEEYADKLRKYYPVKVYKKSI